MNKNLMEIYGVDASKMGGTPLDVVLPKTIGEAQRAVSTNRRIVPRGGGSGLAGGCIPQDNVDVILDLSKLDSISNLDKEHKTVEVEAGVILDDLQKYLSEFGLEFPVKPSSHAIATIGGMIATDAVGNRAIKYGKTSNWVKWIEVIDGEGNIDKKGVTELSDYSGMEGITGVIIRACLKLSFVKKRTARLIEVDDLYRVVEIVRELKRNTEVSAIEFLDKWISEKLGMGKNYHLIVEYEDNSGELKNEEYRNILRKRDEIYPLIASEGFVRIEDPKIMIDRFVKLMNWLESKGVPTFGHIGVGILHPCFNHDQEKFIPEMMKLVGRLSGQISGEHGIGILKKTFVEANDKKILINVKKRTDPLNKFNMGKVI